MKNRDYMPPQPRCWVYELGGGWSVYAGKTDEDNDLLSMHFARQNECWFHVHGMPGSHVILRGPEDEGPNAELIEKAAAVAAWHSKARGGGKCTVDMTLARNVSKPRGAKAGLVCISHERTLRVKPALPEVQEKGEV